MEVRFPSMLVVGLLGVEARVHGTNTFTITYFWDRLSHRNAVRGDSHPYLGSVDLEKGQIFLPGHLTKTGQERLVPITHSNLTARTSAPPKP